jgi:V/A-type H+-transporting ATPase subunit C
VNEFAWASAVGHIRVREKEILSRADLMRLVEAVDLDRALLALRDTYYGTYVAALGSPAEYGDALAAALSAAYELVFGMVPEPMLIAAYRARNDFHNLKVRAKSVQLGIPLDSEALSTMGNFEPDLDPAAVSPRDLDLPVISLNLREAQSLCAALVQTYGQAIELIERTREGTAEGLLSLRVDSLVDRGYYAWFSKVLKRYGYPGMTRFQRAEVDLLNLRMSLRGLRMGLDPVVFGEVVLQGGDIPSDKIVSAYKDGLPGIHSVFRGTPWSGLAVSGAETAEKRESLTKWERACDNAFIGVVRAARYYSIGPEPVFGYLFGKETEVRNLRVILAGKQSYLPAQEIAERLREPYV